MDENKAAEMAIKKEVLEFELVQLRMARRRAKDDALRVKVIAERELEIEQVLQLGLPERELMQAHRPK